MQALLGAFALHRESAHASEARDARLHILGLMKAAMPAHAASLPPACWKMAGDAADVGHLEGGDDGVITG